MSLVNKIAILPGIVSLKAVGQKLVVLGLSHLSRTPEPPVGLTHSSPKLHLSLRAHTGPLYTHSINLSNQNRHMPYNKASLHLCINIPSSQYGPCDTISVELLPPH